VQIEISDSRCRATPAVAIRQFDEHIRFKSSSRRDQGPAGRNLTGNRFCTWFGTIYGILADYEDQNDTILCVRTPSSKDR